MNSSLTLAEVLQVVAEQARLVVGCHQSITSFTAGEDLSQAVNAISLSDKYAAWRTYDEKPDGTGIYRLVVEKNRPYRLTQEELESHPAFRGFSWAAARHPPMRGWLAVPIVDRRGENIGIIQLSDKFEGEFDEEDEQILVQLAQIAAVATDNARLYEAEKAGKKRAERSVKAREAFISIASHELRTPITTLGLQLDQIDLAIRKLPGGERFEPKLAVARRQLEKLNGLVTELVDVSRARAGRLDLQLEDVDLGEVAAEVVERMGEQAKLAGCAIALEAPAGIVGRWDRIRLDQVITNLLSNALKYGAGKPVKVAGSGDAAMAHLVVVDHGIGIAPEDQDRVFEPFERIKTMRAGGLGLGLWIVRQIVDRFGGRIRVESELGHGATFCVDIPRAGNPVDEDRVEPT
ncbi:GAF domain-containing sensor histidine kinase [Vulgatibacter incomptus]|nr:GAF domain-containing sensor histidine kinase [Vulgatibacter incomptus]